MKLEQKSEHLFQSRNTGAECRGLQTTACRALHSWALARQSATSTAGRIGLRDVANDSRIPRAKCGSLNAATSSAAFGQLDSTASALDALEDLRQRPRQPLAIKLIPRQGC